MTNTGFDARKSEEEAIKPDIPTLRTQEGIGTNTAGKSSGGGASDTAGNSSYSATSSTSKGSSGAVKDSTSNRAASPNDLKDAEEEPEAEAKPEKSLYNENGEKKQQGIKGRLKRLGKGKLFIGFGASSGFVGLLILLIVLLGVLKIPDLAQNIITYEFARVTRQFGETADSSAEQALALESANDSTWSALKEKYSGLRDATWGRLDNYRPSKVIDTLGEENGLKLNFKASNIPGRGNILQSIEIGGQTVEAEQLSGASKWVPVLRNIQTIKNQAKIVSQVKPLVQGALDANEDDVRFLIRVGVANDLRKLAGIGLSGFVLGNFKDYSDDPNGARLVEEREKVANIDGASSTPDNAKTGEITNEEQTLEADEKAALGNDQQLQATIDKGGIPPSEITDLNKSFLSTADNIIEAANPLYAAAVPLCIIYDGSVLNSGPTIDNQINQQQAAFYYTESIADQQKQGSLSTYGPSSDTELATAVDAANSDFGDTTQSNAEIRAAGGNVNTSSSLSAEAGAGGSYTFNIINSLGINGIEGTVANFILSNACPVLTSYEFGGGLALLNLGLTVLSGGGTEAAEEGVGEVATKSVQQAVSDLIKNVFAKRVETNGVVNVETTFASRATKFIATQGKIVVATAGATELAHTIVASRAGQMNSGLSQGTDLANEADSGGNIQANEIERSQLFGRPLLNDEICQSNIDDQAYMSSENSQRSAYDRFLNPSNTNSLLAKTAVMLNQSLGSSISDSLVHLGSALLKPIASLADMFLGRSFAAADCNAATTDYGNVQFGWSDDEENLMNSNDSYTMLQNQKILDDAGTEDQIAHKYAACFGYKYNPNGDGNYDPTDPLGDLQLATGAGQAGSLGTLLSANSGGTPTYIDRDSSGNVVNDPNSICSPMNLSYNNDQFGPGMVFRWRLAMRYDTTIDQYQSVQNVSE